MFKDKVAVVTGGGSGIGEAICQQLASDGAFVYVAGIQRDQVDTVVDKITSEGGTAIAACFDVTDYSEYATFVTDVVETSGRIDYLFNNAGVTLISELKDTAIEHCAETMNTNFFGVLNGINLIYPIMARQGFGHIVNTASLAGILGYPTSAVYAASKGAVIVLSKSLRYEAKAFGVKVSVACPGYVETAIFRQERILGASVDSIIDGLPFTMISAEQAARAILRGVQKNKANIIFPFYARVITFLGMLCPVLLKSKYEEVISSFRSDSSAGPKS